MSQRTATTTEMTSERQGLGPAHDGHRRAPSRGEPGEEVGGPPHQRRRPGPGCSAPPKRSDAARGAPAWPRAARARHGIHFRGVQPHRDRSRVARVRPGPRRAPPRPPAPGDPPHRGPRAPAHRAVRRRPHRRRRRPARHRRRPGLRPLRPPARPERPRAVGRRVAGGDLRPGRARARARHRPPARRGRLELAHRRARRPAASATSPRRAP